MEEAREIMDVDEEDRYLSWRDVASRFQCGRSKALLLMRAIGPVYVGSTMFVRSGDVERALRERGEIRICWR